jgi:elongation factor Ts
MGTPMAEITASMVKELRDKTGAGMMDCKNALKESNGDLEAAVDWLRKKGLSKAAGKADRIAAQGLVGLVAKGRQGAVVEVNSETDFVARNAQFQEMVTTITDLALKSNGDLAKLLSAPYSGGKETVEEHVKEAVATIGENMGVRRTGALTVKEGVVADYVHGKVQDGLGKIGTLVALESAGDEPSLFEFGRQLAMHIAATSPLALDLAGVPADTLEREKAILRDKNQGKPAGVIDKIIDSGMKSYAKEYTLLEQSYIHDPSKTVAQAVKDAEKVAGSAIKVAGFLRYALGEGIEKKTEDFAAEVAKTAAAAAR